MALRMNLYGWSIVDFKKAIGSKDDEALKKATEQINKNLSNESSQSKGKAWLHTLIEKGYPFSTGAMTISGPQDGSLLTVQMETEVHAFAVFAIARVISRDVSIDLARESSYWAIPSIGGLYSDMAACGFNKTKAFGIKFIKLYNALCKGTPFFGDEFRTEWSFYSAFTNDELDCMIPVFQAAVDYKRAIPDGYPDEITKHMKIELSEDGKRLAMDLVKWFGQIQKAGQDALVFWW